MRTAPDTGRTRFPALGTTVELLAIPATSLPVALAILRKELADIDMACSRFRDDSELMALNRADGGWKTVSPLFLEAVVTALVAAAQSQGAVDPTIGPALGLLGYDCDFSQIAKTGPAALLTLRPAAGWRRVGVDTAGGRLRLPAGVELDLGATAKALAADRASTAGARATGGSILISIGGDLATSGPVPPDGWLVRVTDDHRGPVEAAGQTVTLAGGALATSSTTARSWRRGDQLVHHIVDPTSGAPAHGPWRTVSAAAATCVDANTATTAALVRGEDAVPWLRQTGLPCRLVSHGGEVMALNGWPQEVA